MRTLLGLIVLVALLVVGCGTDPVDPAHFKQTWTKAYGDTSCQEWNDEMADDQRRVAAADMLYSLRKKNGDPTLPADDMIGTFALDVSDMCHAPAGEVSTIADIGALVYVAFPERFKP